MKQQSGTKHESRKESAATAANKVTATAFSPQVKSKILARWNKLASRDVDAMNGNINLLVSKIQEVYNYTKTKAETECEEFKKANILKM